MSALTAQPRQWIGIAGQTFEAAIPPPALRRIASLALNVVTAHPGGAGNDRGVRHFPETDLRRRNKSMISCHYGNQREAT
jgi:hypothetical protein